MATPDMQQLVDLAEAALIIFVMNEQYAFHLYKTHAENPEIDEGEIVTMLIIRKPILPLVHTSPVVDAVEEVERV